MERLMPDGVTTMIANLQQRAMQLNLMLDDNQSHRIAFTYYIRQEVGLTDALSSQLKYYEKIKRYFLRDDYVNTPKEFLKILEEMNNITPLIDPSINVNNKLNDSELWTCFHGSLNADWENKAK